MGFKVLVTGANGFVGKELCSCLLKEKKNVTGAVRASNNTYLWPTKSVGDITNSTDWFSVLKGVDYLIHTAARVHMMNDSSASTLDDFREVNTYGTINLAQQAADAGVQRFIFISSIKVNGESTQFGKTFKSCDTFIPIDPYGLSKYEAEIGLRKISQDTGMEVVIIRPPLVYGPGVRANFSSMIKWMNKGLPLPLGGITKNKRSLVSVDNLVDLIITCIDHPKAANQTFLVSDDDDVSTTQLLNNMANALGKPSRLLNIPSFTFEVLARLINKPAISQRLCGSLQVDISKTKELLNWTPPYSSADCMNKTANTFLDNLNKQKI